MRRPAFIPTSNELNNYIVTINITTIMNNVIENPALREQTPPRGMLLHCGAELVIKATDCGAITPSQIPDVLKEWRTPTHEDFQPRNAWSLFNAATEVMKGINPNTVVHRTQALHGLFDGLVGLS